MCTVTYLPRPGGFILSHNRDEAPSRTSQTIVRQRTSAGHTLLFPRDKGAGGTWICTSSQGLSACLLNGAFIKHQHRPPYRRSRGLMLLDFFELGPDDFFRNYDFEGIEPFTLLFFDRPERLENGNVTLRRILECRWDEQKRYITTFSSNEPHFWCSATLYPPEMQLRREKVFREWLNTYSASESRSEHASGNFPLSQITRLHRTGSVQDPENDYVMNRAEKVRTVSITQVILDEKKARMRYFDLLGVNRSERQLSYGERRPGAVNR